MRKRKGRQRGEERGGILFISLGTKGARELVVLHDKENQGEELVHSLSVGDVEVLLGPDKEDVGHHLLGHLVPEEVLLRETCWGRKKREEEGRREMWVKGVKSLRNEKKKKKGHTCDRRPGEWF